MLPLELTAIDLILVITVILLLILYFTRFSENQFDKKYFTPSISNEVDSKKETQEVPFQKAILKSKDDYTICPRGFGNIRKFSDDNSISDRCLGCYQIMECYSENR